ncbi:sulfotransferase ssu-1 [Parasteatoda tepidariorum]|uniref:sulfotransferase ssu-1 n=1 Tax=Parasteatoda tepidariorum TaxID=114398 RepID=UPI001C726859|nr:sulfotransferase ssu-1 [Parasteatoda tepidariorum]XP_015923173.2 sulfotransferase ssu-1 [Parasteatoda tepidariorum]XP_042907580.1 sulfotransferase ssu-1 [Parasteatoda tepidariorum]
MAKMTKAPLYSRMDGIIYPSMFSPTCFKEALNYKAQPNDTFIVTYPKCGTTWMQHILMYIFRKGEELENMAEFIKYCPFIDVCGLESIQKMKKPGCIKTHLPYNHLSLSPEAKYIFVARNPKDCCVSFYHHARNHPGFGYWDGNFNDFFELFMDGELEYNDYFDHLLSWYPHRNDPNVFYTTYEEMKKDIRGVVVSVSKFLGQEYAEAIEKDNSVLNNIILFSSFEYMQKHYSRPSLTEMKELNTETYSGIKYVAEFVASLDVPSKIVKGNNVRKGIVGDWKNVLNNEQNQRLTEKFFDKTKDTDISNWFSQAII